MDPYQLAIDDLAKEGKPNISMIARRHHVDRSTLSRRWNKVASTKQDQYENQRFLTEQQERTLVTYINKLTELGLPLTPVMVTNFAYDIVQKWPGKSWCSRF